MRIEFRTYDGVRICLLDFSNLDTEAKGLAAVAEAHPVIAAEPPKSVYTITDVTGSRVTPKLRAALQELTQHNKPYVLFGAVVGLSAVQRVILRGIVQITGRRLVGVDSMAAAITAVQTEAGKR